MICPKCAGLMVGEWVQDYWRPLWQARCLQCGLVLDSVMYANRQQSLSKGVTMPKFLSEEARQVYIKKCAATKEAKRRTQNEEVVVLDGDGEQALIPEPKTNGHEHNGHDGPSWKVQALLKLYDSRESLQQQLADLEKTIQTVKALA